MKNRNRQRSNRRIKEELLASKDVCGVRDPTPYEAVKNTISEFKKGRIQNEVFKNVRRI